MHPYQQLLQTIDYLTLAQFQNVILREGREKCVCISVQNLMELCLKHNKKTAG